MTRLVVHAQTIENRGYELLNSAIENIINPLMVLLIGIGVVVFLWGVVEFIGNTDSEEGRRNGKRHIIWGIIGIAIMVSVFGIMNLICDTIGC